MPQHVRVFLAWFQLPLLASLLAAETLTVQSADGLDVWTRRNPLPTGSSLSAVTSGASNFVAVGQAGTILRSANGLDWKEDLSGTTNWLYGVASGGDRSIAVGENGTILNSTNGGTWTTQTTPQTGTLRAAAYGNSRFVTVGDSGKILTSNAEGLTWQVRTSGTLQRLFGVAFGRGLFVAVGDGGTVLSSTDGVVWQRPFVNVVSPLFAVVAHANGFIVAGDEGVILTSTNGVQWTKQTVAGMEPWFALTVSGDAFFVAGAAGRLARSTNGVAWVSQPSGVLLTLRGLASGNDHLIAVGDSGTITRSTDGLSWQRQTSGSQALLLFNRFLQGRFVAGGSDGTLLVSQNGTNWLPVAVETTEGFLAATYGRSNYIAVGAAGTVATSLNGEIWTRRSSGTAQTLRAVAVGDSRFVAAGESGRILSSSNAVDWTPEISGTDLALNALVFAQSLFVAVGDAGAILTSPDGTVWTKRATGVSERLNGLSFGNGLFVAVGEMGAILTSVDAVSWQHQLFDGATPLLGVTVGNGYFVAVGGGGVILSSLTGKDWIRHQSGVPNSLFGVAFGYRRMITVGVQGTILQSGEIIPPPPVVTLEVVDATAREPGEDTAQFVIARSGSDDEELIVRLGYGGDTEAGVDYVTPQAFVVIPPGESSTPLFITALDDSVKEPAEEVVVTVLSGTGYTLGEKKTAHATLVDNDAVAVSIAAAADRVIEGALTNVVFILTRSGPTNESVSVQIELGGTAALGTDYTWQAGLIPIPAGETNASWHVTLMDDLQREGLETLTAVVLVTAQYTIGESPRATITIEDDDLNRISLVPLDLMAAEPGLDTGAFAVLRRGSTVEAVTVKLSISGSAMNGEDYLRLTNAVVLPERATEATVNISPIDDNVVDPAKELIIRLLPDPEYEIVGVSELVIRIEDNDALLPPILRPPLGIVAGELSFRIFTPIGQEYRIEASEDLQQWHPVATLLQTQGVMPFREAVSTNQIRFYRAVVLP